ncbi:hypothetical protein, partial [Rikenella microfusus]|uniref:hypothetical protein n=1 Tax=Rikenella microfusus TaxID=28139 RepID=UPI00266E9B49
MRRVIAGLIISLFREVCKKIEKLFSIFFGESGKSRTFVSQSTQGSLAQLVQSVCLTSRGSGVRIPQL